MRDVHHTHLSDRTTLITKEREQAALFARGLQHSDILEFDRITQLGAKMIGVPICLVSLVEQQRQYFAGASGLSTSQCEIRETPINYSFCQTVVSSRRVVVVTDAREDSRFCKNPAIEELGVVAYLGFPVTDGLGNVLGAFCLIDSKERNWSDEQIDAARDCAAMVSTQIQFQIERKESQNLFDVLLHDLKSPLAAVDFSARLLLEKKDSISAELQPLLETITNSSQQAFKLLESINVREEEAQTHDVCDLMGVLAALLENFEVLAAQKEITFSVELSSESLPIAADCWLAERILDNLIDNALKYSERGGHVSILEAGDSQTVGFLIRDSGPGFAEEDLPLLFQRYSRLSARPTEDEASSGLGLSIAKRLTEQAGGSLELRSAPGESAEFEILFPRKV